MARRLRLLAVAVLGVAALGVAALTVRWLRGRTRPNVVLMVVDTLRADRLGSYGSGRGLTPFLDGLAARGVRFADAYAASSWTNPSVASLFTSRFPSQHRVVALDSKLPDGEMTLAELFARAGWETVGFTANLRLDPTLGFAQGFAGWGVFATVHKITVMQLVRRALRWVRIVWQPRARKPLFLYLHFMEPHSPYDPPARHRPPLPAGIDVAGVDRKLLTLAWDELSPREQALLPALYDGEVAALDDGLRRAFAVLGRAGVLDDAIVVLTADHGEALGDHGGWLHGFTLFDEVLHVPLLLWVPGQPPAVIRENVSLVDVGPTLLALAGLPPEPRFEGRSLVPLLRGERATADVVAELPQPGSARDLTRHAQALVRGTLKLIVPRVGGALGRPVLYDLATDPGERSPDPPAQAGRAPALAAALARTEAMLATRAGPAEHAPVDARTRARLRALGYAD